MAETSERLERLITAEQGQCCPKDVEDRLGSLETAFEATDGPAAVDVPALRTLGDGTRYKIVRLSIGADRELCVCEITPLFEVSESAVSHALSDLVDAGLLARRKDGTWRYYEATERARAILDALDETREATA
jgi:DNA-binding transcriptional ArsR family regulator